MAKNKRHLVRNEAKAMEKEYNLYKKYRLQAIGQGYSLDPILKKDEFNDYYRKAWESGIDNVARDFVEHEKVFTYKEARYIKENIRNLTAREGLDADKVQILKKDFNNIGKLTGTKLTREQFFNRLLEMGLTEHEAEKFMYEDSNEE